MHRWSQQNKLSIKRVVDSSTVVANLRYHTARVKQVCLTVTAFQTSQREIQMISENLRRAINRGCRDQFSLYLICQRPQAEAQPTTITCILNLKPNLSQKLQPIIFKYV